MQIKLCCQHDFNLLTCIPTYLTRLYRLFEKDGSQYIVILNLFTEETKCRNLRHKGNYLIRIMQIK